MYTLITGANSAEAHALKNNMSGGSVIMGDFEELPEFLVNSGKMIRLPNPISTRYWRFAWIEMSTKYAL